PDAREQRRRSAASTAYRRRRPTVRGLVIAALVVLGVIFSYPFIWLVSASFKPRGEVFDNRLIPKTFTFENYITVWQEAPLALWLLNTLIVTVLAAVTVTMSSAMSRGGSPSFRSRGRAPPFAPVLRPLLLPVAFRLSRRS